MRQLQALIHDLVFILFPVVLYVNLDAVDMNKSIPRFGVFEASFIATGTYDNPYTELHPIANVRYPDGDTGEFPLFWDGGAVWKLRISPDKVGDWRFSIRSNDGGLDKQNGIFKCVSSNNRGSILPMPKFGHHFVLSDGTPFLFWGDTAWALYQDQSDENLNREAVLHYIDKRAAEGINVIHSMLLQEAGWGNSGGMPFWDISIETINPSYWQEVDTRLAYLTEKGIIAGLVLGWGHKRKQNEPFAWNQFSGLEARKRYARYIAARYSAYPVYFIVSGEWDAEAVTRKNTSSEEVRDEFYEIGNALHDADSHNRMIGIHNMANMGSVREFNDATWMDFADYQQNYRSIHQRILDSRSYGKPVVNSEYGYYLRDASENGKPDKSNSISSEDMRFATWDIIMAGGYPVTGYGTTYMGGHRDPGPFNPDDPRNEEWSREYHIARDFLTGLDWWKLRPMDQLIIAATPRSHDREVEVQTSPTRTRKLVRPPAVCYWLLANPDVTYIAYARGLQETVRIQFQKSEAGKYRLELFNPRTGEVKILGQQNLKDHFEWIPPDTNDWVLHLVHITN